MEIVNGNLLDFSRKTVLITGAATGIGRGVTMGFASRGANVAIGDTTRRQHPRRSISKGEPALACFSSGRTCPSRLTSRSSSPQPSTASAGPRCAERLRRFVAPAFCTRERLLELRSAVCVATVWNSSPRPEVFSVFRKGVRR
jgi:NAD(P)-dependent dehydrogenase (short-subunit alcohol dehydrogenase family)